MHVLPQSSCALIQVAAFFSFFFLQMLMNVRPGPTTVQGLARPELNVSMNQGVSDVHAVKAMTSTQQRIIDVKVCEAIV